MECLVDLKRNLKKHGLDLLIKQGKPEDILPSLAKEYGAHTVTILIFLQFLCIFLLLVLPD